MLKTGYKVVLVDGNNDEVKSWDYVKDFNPANFEGAINQYETDEIKRLEEQDKRIAFWQQNPQMSWAEMDIAYTKAKGGTV